MTRSLAKNIILVNFPGLMALVLLCGTVSAQNRSEAPLSADYTNSVKIYPRFLEPYRPRIISGPDLANAADAPLTIQDGKLRLSMAQLIAAVVENNLTVASARYYPAIAQVDLLRARSGASPRGVDASVIPSAVFAGAQGGSILAGGGGGGGGGGLAAGGITGSATAVRVGPVGLFDPTFSANFSVDHTASPLNSLVVAGVPSVTNTTLAASFNYTQAFPSGTSFTVSYSMQRQQSTQLRLLYDPDYTPGFSASVTQQMLNGFGFKVNRALIEVAQNEQTIERESFREQLIAALVSAKNAYWDMIAAQQAVRAAEQAVKVAQQLEANNQRELRVGLMAPLDVITAQSQVASSQRDLVIAQTNQQYAELQLKSMLSKNLDEPFASATVEATDSFPEPDNAQLPKLEDAVAIANKNRPEISVAQGNVKSQQDVTPFIRNSLLPNVNLFASMSTVGLYNVFGTAFTDLVSFKFPQVAFGVTINFSLHNRQAQADSIRSRLEMQQSEDTLVRTKNQVDVDVQSALIAITQGKAQVAAARAAVRLYEEQLDAEQKKLTAGLSTSYNVILIQRDLFTAQVAEVQARDGYAKALVALDQAMGVTLENNQVSLDDALRGTLPPRN